jgi:predicted membrane chloride channel (bestrophin family)
MNLDLIGLVVIALAWVAQIIFAWNSGSRQIKKQFLGLYCLGVLLLVIDGYWYKDSSSATLNLLALVLAFLVFLTTMRKQNTVVLKKKKR